MSASYPISQRGFKVPLPHADTEPPQASRAADFVTADKLDRILHILAERALQETGATSVAIGLIREDGVTCRAIAGQAIVDIGDPINRETGLTGLAIRRQMSQWCSDTESEARVDQEVCRQLGVRSIIVVPLLVQDAVVGVFAIFSGNPDALSLSDLKTVKKLSHWASEAVRRTIVKTPPANIAPAVVGRKLSDHQPPTTFSSAHPQESGPRNYAAKIWRATARVLLGGQRGRTS